MKLNHPMAIRVYNELASVPEGPAPANIEMFQAIRNDAFAFIVQEWQKIESLPIFDPAAKFAEWEDQDKLGYLQINTGMRLQDSKAPDGLKHGIVRLVHEGGNLYVGSFKYGVEHGLKICYANEQLFVRLFKSGREASYFAFDANFRETSRFGKELNHLTPMHFNPKVTAVSMSMARSKKRSLSPNQRSKTTKKSSLTH